jgi:hypothetical protein
VGGYYEQIPSYLIDDFIEKKSDDLKALIKK